jgi:hypothetical protein
MKHLWVILFVLTVSAQDESKTLKLKKDSQVVEFNSNDEVVIRLYKKSPLNIKVFLNRNLKSSIFKTVNFEEGFILTNNAKILFYDIYSIAHVSSGNIAIKNGIRGFKAGAIGGFLVGFLGTLVNDSKPTNPLAMGVMVGTVSSILLFLDGLIRGTFYPNISDEYIIGKNKWIIIQ